MVKASTHPAVRSCTPYTITKIHSWLRSGTVMKYLGCPKLSIGSELDLPHHEELNVASRFMATCLAVTEPAVSLSVAAHPIDATANTAAPVNPATRHAFGFCPRIGVPTTWGQVSRLESALNPRETLDLLPHLPDSPPGLGVQGSDLHCTAPARPRLAPQRFKTAVSTIHQLMR